MIRSLTIRNFRSWKDSGAVRFAPLTGFFGTNSSGKSSLLQMLVLLKQTVDGPAGGSGPLRLGGPGSLMEFRSFRDVLHRGNGPLEVQLAWLRDQGAGKESVATDFSVAIAQEKGGSLQVVRLEVNPPLPALLRPLSEASSELRMSLALMSAFTDTLYIGPIRKAVPPTHRTSGRGDSSRAFDTDEALSRLAWLERDGSPGGEGEEAIARVGKSLQSCGLATAFRLRWLDKSDGVFVAEVKIRPRSPWVNAADVGFGLCQVLPVVIAAITAPSGGKLMIEQPELHLHPAAQSAMADVLLDAARRGVQVIFESHSEHLLRRIQRRIAEGDPGPEDTAFAFVRLNSQAESVLTPLQVDELGNIVNWPEDFFGDQFGEINAMAEAQHRRRNGHR